MPIERGLDPHINHASENSKNYINFFTYSEYKKEQTKYSYFKLEKVFGTRKANFINKLKYWLSKCGRNINGISGKWIYNPTHEWANQLNCSTSTIKRLIKSLEEQGIILSKKVNAKRYNQTKWYSLNFNLLNNMLTSQDIKDNTVKNKWTNRLVQNEPIIISNNRNNYTNTSSKKFKNNYSDSKEEEINFSNVLKERTAQKTKLTTNETKLVEQMVYLWNKVFIYSRNPIKAYISKSNKKALVDVLNNHFEGDLDKWREYALAVNSSQFLMGEKETKKNFRAIFSWLIKEETLEKIMNNEYGIGDRELDMNNISKNIEEKKEEVVNKMDKKISEYMKIKINDKKEREEFIEYVKSASITEDDRYGILKNIIKQVPKNYILEREEYKEIKENLYESYVMKKHLSITKIEVREKIRNKIKKIIENKENSHKLLEELDKKIMKKQVLKQMS
ncbi:uncharacterized protein TRIADDRAFT_62511 [Trichoplax adhaerens]|uniref:Uncharacterized protein n=1 Tax=Trichoplax adhaerens TaxID=10228 RepID=B3SE07_TRIAD|nr:hypothetical protein TRIADDRAFT_62511 [Trichoplax adhaerens]EDV19037.1 hypothetical protein TRIADDRAFT_62511 [Trichoplax adhaerens]|eukprot:XP_002118476.1 hypothetical protein TRIADDRAFT_62511 [Trichoplax adhaerens]